MSKISDSGYELFQNISYPIEGSIINGIEITETVVERLCYTNIQIKNISSNMNFPFTETYPKKEWGFLIGIYKSFDKDYLIIHSNKLSDFIELLEENNCETTKGPVLLNFEDAKRITTRLKNFNTNTKNKNYKILNFEQVISSITSFANNSIFFSFCPLTSVNGFFLPSDQHIVVANNQTDFEIIFTLVHEITHSIIMSYSQDEIESSPSNWIEYTISASEYLCNSVAMEVLLYLIDKSYIICADENGNRITQEDIQKIFYKESLNLKITDSVLSSTTPGVKTIISDCKNIITDMLISSILKNLDSTHHVQFAHCYPNYDLIPLDEQENKQLYAIISKLLKLPHNFTALI